jgi:hypothetical protein
MMRFNRFPMRSFAAAVLFGLAPAIAAAVEFKGAILDAESAEPLPARVYLQSKRGWHFVRSSDNNGSAVEYNKQRADGRSVEMHTTVSAHPFVADLPTGQYTLTVERGKEYLPEAVTFTIEDQPVARVILLQRWIDMAARGWYSGDTHVHRKLSELPNVMLAEDLNVALPLTGWVTEGFASPEPRYSQETGRVETELIEVDKTHVIYPLNTEWEIFTVGGQRHTLGAVFALGHKRPFQLGAPPVAPIAEEARRQGALLELDKHNWPWSMMLVPVMEVDLFELTNNHIWRTAFAFDNFYPEYAADYMNLEMKDGRFTERGWIEFGFQNYYTLLNCGFRMRPTAGTASGVHPVPLGFGRVYVELPDGFSYEKWMRGLDAGRSFVTTGPMLLVRANGRPAGSSFEVTDGKPSCHLTGSVVSARPVSHLEVVVNGEIRGVALPTASSDSAPARMDSQAIEVPIDVDVQLEGSSWVAVRCLYVTEDGRPRFAHSSPFFFDVSGQPLRPRKVETAYLIGRIKQELARHRDVLPATSLDEYQTALDVYEKLHATAR